MPDPDFDPEAIGKWRWITWTFHVNWVEWIGDLFKKGGRKMKKLFKGMFCLMLAFLLVACAGFMENAYKSEYVTGTGYNVGMGTIARLQSVGTVTAEQRAKVNAKADLVYKAYIVSVDALITYYHAKDKESAQEIVNTAVTALFQNWADLAALINSISPNTVPTDTMTLKGVSPGGDETMVTVKKLDSGTIQIIIQIGTAVLEIVLPEIQKVISVLQQKNVTLEEIQALKKLIKPPTQY